MTRLAVGLDPTWMWKKTLGISEDGIKAPMESGSPLSYDIMAPMESGSPLSYGIKAPMESGSPLRYDIVA